MTGSRPVIDVAGLDPTGMKDCTPAIVDCDIIGDLGNPVCGLTVRMT